MAAYNFCKRNHMELMTMETLTEVQNFQKLWRKNKKTLNAIVEGDNGVQALIGSVTTRLMSKTLWFSFKTGVKLNYKIPWSDGQPNNFEGNRPVAQYCSSFTVNVKTMGFNDRNCGQHNKIFMAFICQDVVRK